MKLLTIVHNHSSLHPGGTELVAESLHQAYRSMPGVEAILLAGADPALRPGLPGTSISADGNDPTVYHFRAHGFSRFDMAHDGLEHLAYDLRWFLEDMRPNVVHIHHFNFFGMELLGLIKTVLPKAKIIVTLHDYGLICSHDGLLYTTGGERCLKPTAEACHRCFPEQSMAMFASKWLFIRNSLKLADRITAPSRFLKDRFVDWGLPADRIAVIRNGWAPAPFGDGVPDSRRFVMLGNLRPTKGSLVAIEAMIDAARRTDRPPILDIYGAPLYQPEEFVAALECLERAGDGIIRLHGRYHHDEAPRLIAGGAWLVVPSLWWENAPLVINEAFSQGRPVLCSDIGGMAEAVRDGIDGLHVRAGDKYAWSDAFQRTCGNDALWQELSGGIEAPRSAGQSAAEFLGLLDLARAA